MLTKARVPVELQNRWAFFQINDIRRPEPVAVLNELYGKNLLQGQVIEFCTNDGEVFAVLRVEGIANPVIVAIDRINVV